jgi:hypothetical protein
VSGVRIGRIAVLSILLSAACSQSPLVAFRRAVDQAASWAAAIQYAHDLESHRAVPGAYLQNIVKEGTTAIETVRRTIAEAPDLPADLKAEATTLCDRMIGELTPENIDVTRLAEIEHAFRALSSKAGGR